VEGLPPDIETAGTVTFVGRWSDLTAGVSRTLAEWAAEDPLRGCGVLPPSTRADAEVPHLVAPRPSVGIVVHGDAPIEAGWVSEAGYREVDESAVVAAVTSDAPPVGIAVGGHGSEYCLRMGAFWLTVDPRAAPPGPTLEPGRVRCPAVFLNACGSLRLGDSPIPVSQSVAAALYAAGASVIGPFRNQYGVPDAERLFASALAAGLPMGRVVNAVNRGVADRCGVRPAYQLLGDPARVVWEGPRVDVPLADHPASPGVERMIGEVSRLERLDLTLARWAERSPRLQSASATFTAMGRRVYVADRVAALGRLDDRELDVLATTTANAVWALRRALLDELTAWAAEKWIDQLYAPFHRPPAVSEGLCPCCRAFAFTYLHEPYAAHLLGVERVECDRCGAVSDRIGVVPDSPPRFDARVIGDRIEVRHHGCGRGCLGRIVIRDGGADCEWPDKPGLLVFEAGSLLKRGRLVLAGVAVGDGHAALHYRTVFVPYD
jgi:hypothetical protein